MKFINLVLGVGLWFARLVERVVLWGLSVWAYIAALGCIGLVLSLHWVALTLSNQISGLHFPIFGYVPNHAANPLLSWGVAAALLFVLAAWTYSHRQWRTLSLVGAALLLMCFFSLLQVAFGNAALLKKLVDEEKEWVTIQKFQGRFQPTCFRVEESNSDGPILTANIQTAWDRLVVARYFMGMGFYLTVTVGLLCFLYAKAHLLAQERSRLTKGTLLIAACLAIVFCSRAVAAHILVTWGHAAEASGNPDLAIHRYRRAMRLDPWFAVRMGLYQRIGAIDANFGRSDTLEYGVFDSERLFAQGDFQEAIARLEKVIPNAGNLAQVLREREAEMWAEYGLVLYNQHAIAAAIPTWETALARDPSRRLAAYCLARAYFAVGRYQESLTLTQRVIGAIRDPVMHAQLLSDLGDAYTRLGQLAPAHVAYRQSFLLDYVYNWRGLSGTVGGQSNISLQDSDASPGRINP
jgi:tetratricopeptide (TPR) repeat protein